MKSWRTFVDSSTEDTLQLVGAMVRGVGEVWLHPWLPTTSGLGVLMRHS